MSKKLHRNTLWHTWDTVILLKTAYFKHFEHFAAIEKFKTTNFAANHCEYVHNWLQLHDSHHYWEKNCVALPWGTPEIQWFCIKQLKTAYFSILSIFQLLKFLKKKFAANHCEYVWNWSQQHDFHHRWEKNCMGIPWGTPEIQWFWLKQPKTAYFKHFEHFPAIEMFEKIKFAANHCEYVSNWSQQHDFHYRWVKNCMGIPWGTPEIQWFCLKQLKTAYFKHFEHFPAIEIFEKKKFAANHCEYV